jgi:hypothetical protein
VEGFWSPWETPDRQRLAGGWPQLTAGIRAGSYAHEFSNRGFPPSMQQIAQTVSELTRQRTLPMHRPQSNGLEWIFHFPSIFHSFSHPRVFILFSPGNCQLP